MSERPTPDEARTEEQPPLAGAASGDTADYELGLPPAEALDEDDDWPVRGPARGIRLGLPVAGLVAVLLVAAGFWGGAVVEKNHGTSGGGGSNSGLAALASRFRAGRGGTTGASGASGATGASGASGFPGFGGSGSATAGTISVVDGNTLYVLTAAGSLVQVDLSSSTTITRNATAQADGLRPGDTVVIQGSTGSNGKVAATSVTAVAPGVSSGFGGRGFAGSGAAGAGTTTTTTTTTTTAG
jgi:hypothetical protein